VAGTLEYAVDHLGTPVIVVLGHTSCGLVAAASVDGPVSPSLLPMITAVQPAVAEARKVAPGNVVAAAVQFNVFGQITRLIEQSPAIASAVESERLLVVGAVYDLSTGRVQWLGSHPDEESIIAQAGGKSRREAATAPAVTNPFAPRPQPTSDERRRFVNVPTRP
jgi:carbonic anhydrase